MEVRVGGNFTGQVAGGHIINTELGLDPDNPNLMPCPACERPVSRGADVCLDCGDNLLARRIMAARQARNARITKISLGLLAVLGVCWLVANYVPALAMPASVIGFLAGAGIYQLTKDIG